MPHGRCSLPRAPPKTHGALGMRNAHRNRKKRVTRQGVPVSTSNNTGGVGAEVPRHWSLQLAGPTNPQTYRTREQHHTVETNVMQHAQRI